MLLTEQLKYPGEHPIFFTGEAGQIELILTVPPQANTQYMAFLGHPHSLQGGTMNNKVVTTLVRVFKELNIPSIRFNFRGVGKSAGVYNDGIGESEDMLLLAQKWQQELPSTLFIFAGFSFGSYVAYRAAGQFPHQLLITIAPSVQHYNYAEFNPMPTPWIVVQGEEDEVVPSELVIDFAAQAAVPIIRFPGTGHFFHGKLIELKSQLIASICTQVNLLCP